MSRSAVLHRDSHTLLEPSPIDAAGESGDDPRWLLTQRVVAGRHFARSPLLSKLLLDIVAETLAGRQDAITEHKLGVRVFGRPASYRTVEDNIIRNYARQLRKRLGEHFDGEGSAENGRVRIPIGGYIPVFSFSTNSEIETDERTHTQEGPSPVLLELHATDRAIHVQSARNETPPARRRALLRLLALFAYTALLIGGTWLAATRLPVHPAFKDAATPLWQALFKSRHCYIVPDDAGLNLMEDLAHEPIKLVDYIQESYRTLPLTHGSGHTLDSHTLDDLRTQQFTSFVGLEIASGIARRPEYNAERVSLRFPRDLRLDDLKDSNAIIIGSVGSNPWAAVSAGGGNFEIVNRTGMSGASILNKQPRTGEAPEYVSHWNEPTHETFALIHYLPNLSGNGHLLMVEGLDAAGTQAAAETLFHPEAIARILQGALRPDSSLRPFEILLRSTSLQSNAINTEIIGSRIE